MLKCRMEKSIISYYAMEYSDTISPLHLVCPQALASLLQVVDSVRMAEDGPASHLSGVPFFTSRPGALQVKQGRKQYFWRSFEHCIDHRQYRTSPTSSSSSNYRAHAVLIDLYNG
jgi:hypothetical protein